MHFLSGVEPQCSTNTAEGQRVELCGYIYRRADSSFFFYTLSRFVQFVFFLQGQQGKR